MDFTIIDGLKLTLSAIVIVAASLSLIMAAILLVARMVDKYEHIQRLLKQEEMATLAKSTDVNVSERPSDPPSNKTLFEEDKLARVAVLTALAKASEDQPHKRYEVVSVIKK